MSKQTVKSTSSKTTTVKITPKKSTGTTKKQNRCPTCGAFRK